MSAEDKPVVESLDVDKWFHGEHAAASVAHLKGLWGAVNGDSMEVIPPREDQKALAQISLMRRSAPLVSARAVSNATCCEMFVEEQSALMVNPWE